MSASFGPINECELGDLIQNIDPSLTENLWANDETGNSRSISTGGLRLTFYCGAKTFFVQGQAAKCQIK